MRRHSAGCTMKTRWRQRNWLRASASSIATPTTWKSLRSPRLPKKAGEYWPQRRVRLSQVGAAPHRARHSLSFLDQLPRRHFPKDILEGDFIMGTDRAVLWDMDGNLIDSEEFHWISWRNALATEGIAITREQFLSSFGQRNDSIIPRWLGNASTPERIERIANAKEELYRHLVRRDGISPLPGVANWIHRLHKEGWLQAIASAAPRANIDAVLEALSATHIFQGIVSADDVHRGKPDPDVFLAAASRVGVSPEQCIVVEDAVAGVQGARSAGMRSIGVSHNGAHLPADVVVESLELLEPDAFEMLLEGCPAKNG